MNSTKIEETVKALSLRQKIGQMFLFNFVGKYEVPDHIKQLNRDGLLGGIIYFSGSNVEDLEQLRKLGARIQDLKHESPHGIPPFITLDQEGGQLSALHRGVSVFPGNMALGDADDIRLSEEYAEYTGRLLKYGNISINFAPVLDVAYEARNGVHIVDNRMISSETDVVGRHGKGIIRGMQAGGVLACAKHFPGMRISEKDTHHQMDIIEYSRDEMESIYFPPFREAVEAGVGAIMTHHGVYPAFDDKPATLSPVLLGYLRHELGFDGLIITDDLIMKAVQDQYPGPVACEMAINAGVDQIIITGADEHLIDSLVEAVEAGRIQEATIDASLRRILTAKENIFSKQGIGGDPSAASAVQGGGEVPPAKDHGDALSLEISRKAVHVVSGGELLPRITSLEPMDKLGVILGNPARLVMSDTVNFYDISLKAIIEGAGIHPYVKEAVMPWNPTDEEMLSNFDIGFISDLLIFTTVNAYRFTRQLEILKQIHGLRRDGRTKPYIISVATRSPDDAALLEPYSDVVLTTGGITPNQMTALVETIFGRRIR